jgi:hypothetical protein
MKLNALILSLLSTFFAVRAFAQVVSVDCCVLEEHLLRIGDCLSGPDGTETPSTCRSSATCVLGFGPDDLLAPVLCDPTQPELPDEQRAHCASWVDERLQATDYCVAAQAAGINLFTMYDADGDGDLDLEDVAVFQQTYQSVPKRVQSEAALVSVECCFSEEGLRNMGQCLSGPGVRCSPPVCELHAGCVLGFSDIVELGDYLYELCRGGPDTMPDPDESFCSSWTVEDAPVVQSCTGAYPQGINSFVVSDEDGDADLDLADLAAFQCSFELPPGD